MGGEGFKDVYEKVSGIYDGMKEAVHEQQRQLLMQTAQNLEFALDGEEGMNGTSSTSSANAYPPTSSIIMWRRRGRIRPTRMPPGLSSLLSTKGSRMPLGSLISSTSTLLLTIS